MNTRPTQLALLIIRVSAAGNLLIHGTTRILHGGVTGFDEYLSSLRFPMFSAWIITVFEILAAITIIAGKWITPLCILFCLELAMGIALVHFKEGWFVVGGGSNGMEYSVLLIVCFASLALAHWKK
jgi:putative oxidoreductase